MEHLPAFITQRVMAMAPIRQLCSSKVVAGATDGLQNMLPMIAMKDRKHG